MGSVDIDPTGFSGTLDDITDGTTYKRMLATEQTKLGGVEDNATADQDVNDVKSLFSWTTSPEDGATSDLTGAEIDALISALAIADRNIITSAPTSGQHQLQTIQRKSDGTINFIYNDTPEA